MTLDFEQGPIRPPSEARSLLIRVTRNCPWNRCAFCPVYKGARFSLRTVEEVKKDIDTAKKMVDRITVLSWKMGKSGRVDAAVLDAVARNGQFTDSFRSVAFWLHHGAESAFLQDANSLIMKTPDLLKVVSYMKATFPGLKRITSYARSHTLARKSVESLRELREAGLNRIHVGLESGSDAVLALVKKGTTGAEQIEGGRRVVEAGIELSEYVMPGLGGRELSEDHALETARVLNAVNPHFIRIRSLALPQGTALRDLWEKGKIDRLSDEEIVREERLFLENLEGIRSNVVSDHMLNLLEEVEGRLPEEKPRMLALIDRYLDLPVEDRLLYQLGRRLGHFQTLASLDDPAQRGRVEAIRDQVTAQFGDDLEGAIRTLTERYI
jgi:histone acetyltransferase (RNA polymerase elongator complex component)